MKSEPAGTQSIGIEAAAQAAEVHAETGMKLRYLDGKQMAVNWLMKLKVWG